ncbi:MAG: DUF29 domain-containing protein [Magnetococcus sp. YQC-5]
MTLADTNASLYQTDFHAWTTESARLLREGRYSEIDLISLAEEVESMGANTRQQLVNRLRILLAHLLKWEYQPHLRSRSWQATIKEQRFSIADLLEENPSLTSVLPERITKAYRLAVLLACEGNQPARNNVSFFMPIFYKLNHKP